MGQRHHWAFGGMELGFMEGVSRSRFSLRSDPQIESGRAFVVEVDGHGSPPPAV